MKPAPVPVGIVGCGAVSGDYFEACERFDVLDLRACADLDPEKAEDRAEDMAGVRALTVDRLLADPEIEIVVDLTPPRAHAEIGCAALEAGKHVYHEKPLAARPEDGRRMLELARRRRLRVGCAPDTFLGAPLQTCAALLSSGLLGRPTACAAFMLSAGHESWHPDPEFFYRAGGGPLFDMGPYYLTAMVLLLGPIRRVTGAGRITFPERTVTSEDRRGEKIRVEVPTHVSAHLEFAGGAVGTLVATFDVRASEFPRMEVYGTEGSLAVPDPNGFGGPVRFCLAREKRLVTTPLEPGRGDEARGLGLAEMAQALRRGRPHRASGELAFHVLEAMQAVHDAAERGGHVELTSTCERPAPWPEGPDEAPTTHEPRGAR